MSRRPEPLRPLARLRRPEGDEGFSLVEVLVAMLVFAIIAVAALGFLTTALSAAGATRLESVAKNLSQERLEKMRNLPYSISATVSTTAPDLLETYYTSTATAAATTDSTGFVAAGAARDIGKGDPATGPFFRRVYPQGSIPSYPNFAQRVASQFMQTETAILATPVFNALSTGLAGLPPSSTLGVQVTTLWTSGGKSRKSSVYSQIAETLTKPPVVTLQARLSALRFVGILPGARELVAEAGVVSLDGSLSNSTTASGVAQAVSAAIAGGTRSDGAKQTVAAPPTATAGNVNEGVKTLADGSATVAELSNSSVTGLSASAVNGDPKVGLTATPVTATLKAGGFGDSDLAFTAGNIPDPSSRLGVISRVMRMDVPSGCGGGCTAVEGRGTLTSSSGSTHSATASLSATVNGTISLFPTSTSPGGILRVTLSTFNLTCDSRAGLSPQASTVLNYAGTVSYRTYNPDPLLAEADRYGYSAPIAISSSSSTDPLAAISLSTVPGIGIQVGVDAGALPLYLGDYVQTWSSLTAGSIAAATQLGNNGMSVSLALPGVFTVSSQALGAEAGSTAGIQVGVASCVAADIR